MRIYTVLEPAELTGSSKSPHSSNSADEAIFISDDFSWPAFLLGPFWLAFNRLWLALVGYAVGFVLLQLLVMRGGPAVAVVMWLLTSIAMGYLASDLKAWALERRGYRAATIVAGRSLEECEHRYFATIQGGPGLPSTAIVTAAVTGSQSKP